MSSFKGFLTHGKPTAADFAGSLHVMLTGISRYTLDGREEELAAFRESMLTLADRITVHASGFEVEATVNDALELFRNYNDRGLKFHTAHAGELKAVMRTMLETVTYLSESRTRFVHQLQVMERELEQASQIDDIRLLRNRVINCLDKVREETVRLQNESENRSHEVREQLNRVSNVYEPPARFGAMDAVTGLPARRSAERAIGESVASGFDHAIAIFVVHRLSAINSKYGRSMGDEVMLRVANHFANHLSSSISLFRWSGPALVALIAAQSNMEEIRRSLAKVAAMKQEITLESKQRSVFVLVETAMSFQTISKNTPGDDLFQSMDKFVADQSDEAVHVSLLRH